MLTVVFLSLLGLCSASAPTYAPTKPCSHFPKNQCSKKAFCQWFKNNCVFSINKLQKKLDEMEDSISDLETKNDALENRLNQKISALETKNNALETALNQMTSDIATKNNELEIRLNQKISTEDNALETALTEKISDVETALNPKFSHIYQSLGNLVNMIQDRMDQSDVDQLLANRGYLTTSSLTGIKNDIANLQSDKLDSSDVENLLTSKGYLTTYSLTGIRNDVKALQDRSISLGATEYKVFFNAYDKRSDEVTMTVKKNMYRGGKYDETFCYLTRVSHTSTCWITLNGSYWVLKAVAYDTVSYINCLARCVTVSN